MSIKRRNNFNAKNEWKTFQDKVNDNHGLTWEFSTLSTLATLLDMQFQISDNRRITTTLHEKPIALHLFIPPHSAHRPGVLRSHIFGNILRTFCLNSNKRDIEEDTINFIRRFLTRGHNMTTIRPNFLPVPPAIQKRIFVLTIGVQTLFVISCH